MKLFIATTLLSAASAFSPAARANVRPTTSLDASKCGNFDFDVIIVGCGVGGHGAALHSRAQDLSTAVFSGQDVGGTCVNRGCVPSKALLERATMHPPTASGPRGSITPRAGTAAAGGEAHAITTAREDAGHSSSR